MSGNDTCHFHTASNEIPLSTFWRAGMNAGLNPKGESTKAEAGTSWSRAACSPGSAPTSELVREREINIHFA